MQLDLIWATARYEMLTLLRSWFFRIFAAASLTLFITLDIIFFSSAVDVPRFFYGLSCSVPYANMMMLNIAQVIVIIMLATDFFKRDKKMNTTEVFYIRSMTNATYLVGKLFGIFLIFGGLDILLLIVAALIQLVFSNITFNWITYIIYPAVMVLPVFLFISGLSFLLMSLIKNQAVVVLILLGYCAAEMFYLRDKLFFIFDFLSMNLPLAYSDFVGFANTNLIFWQRGVYVCLGIALIFISSLLFIRLPQSMILKRVSLTVSGIMITLSVYFAYSYLGYYNNLIDRRTEMNQLNTTIEDTVLVEPVSYDIQLKHEGYRLESETRIRFINKAIVSLDSLVFCLNPGLTVLQVRDEGLDVDFKQNQHILKVYLPEPVKPLSPDSITIYCSGSIDPAVCYPDIKNEQFTGRYSFWLYQVHKNYVFLTPDYVLLSPESLWYPQPGLPRGVESLKKDHMKFSNFTLRVSTADHLTVLAQGQSADSTDGVHAFYTDKPLTGLALIIGNYQKKSVTVDSVEFNLFQHPAHDYYSEFFTEITDTLSFLIREVQQEYAVRLNLDYPYNRLSLVEVPVQFYSHPRIWTVARETIQPEQIWFTENAAYINSADFNRLSESMDRRLERSNQTMTENEMQASLFKNFVRYTFHGQTARFMRRGTPTTYNPDFNLFPNYYTFVSNFRTDGHPIMNAAVEAYLYNKVVEKDEGFSFVRTEGLTTEEKVSRLLTERSLAELIRAAEKDDLLNEVIKIKGAYLLKMIQSDVGVDHLDRMITDIINRNRFKPMEFKDFIDMLYRERDFRLSAYLDDWLNTKQLPGFLTSGIRMFKILDEDRIRYQVLFKIQNTESVPAVFDVRFQYGGGGRRMMTDQPEPEDPGRVFKINAGESKEIGIVLDAEPRSTEIDYIIAKNIPLVYSEQFDKAELQDRFHPFDGEKLISALDRITLEDEVIVDNADETFSIINPPYQSLMKRWILTKETEEEFDRFRWWSPPQRWKLLKNTTFFGRYIHSAYYIRSGDGSKLAIWKTALPQEGLYNIFTYMFRRDDLWRSRRRSQLSYGDYNYVIYHSAGSDEVTIDADKSTPGWNYIGTYFFPKDSAKVVLTNESNGRVIIADAVKWVKN